MYQQKQHNKHKQEEEKTQTQTNTLVTHTPKKNTTKTNPSSDWTLEGKGLQVLTVKLRGRRIPRPGQTLGIQIKSTLTRGHLLHKKGATDICRDKRGHRSERNSTTCGIGKKAGKGYYGNSRNGRHGRGVLSSFLFNWGTAKKGEPTWEEL